MNPTCTKTLKITINDTPQAELLVEILRGLAFVKNVEDATSPSAESANRASSDQRARTRTLLLNAPTLSDEELTVYEENRNYLNQWRTR